MSSTYRLYRKSGYLFFNTLGEEDIYWVSIIAAANGGDPMYAKITGDEFEMVFEGHTPVGHFGKYFCRNWMPDSERESEEKYGINDALSVHRLEQYAPKRNPDDTFSPAVDPVKSVISTNESIDRDNQN
ncbi:MAG: hypothetical protein GY875_19500 [Gammaproteobacteria bacterium]|nr:hypothetical protein [Gammaproteobacteria bacterium]